MEKYLPKDHTLKFHECSGEYTIIKVIGRGASAVTYLTYYKDPSGRTSERILKEYVPYGIKIERSEDGNLVYNAKDKNRFETGRKQFEAGGERQNKLRNEANLRNETPPLQNIYEANGTLYLEVTPFDGKTFAQFSNLPLWLRIKVCLAVAKLVKRYHELEYLCLDLKPENIFLLTNSSGEIVTDMIEFIDFDSIRSKKEVSFGESLSFTESWSAPEQNDPYGYMKISEATDIYTIGELVFWSVFDRHSRFDEHRGFSEYPYDSDECPFVREINRPEIKNLFTRLFRNTLRSSSKNRYSSVSDVIVILEKLVEELSRKEYVISTIPVCTTSFVGRKEELQSITEQLEMSRVLFIWGLGGIGKSTLVRNYCVRNASKYDAIIYLQHSVNLRSAFIDDRQFRINTIEKKEESAEEYFGRKLRHLEDVLLGKKVLFVIDNYNDAIIEELSPIIRQPWNVIVVSRRRPPRGTYGELEIRAIHEQELYRLFEENLGEDISEEEKESIQGIITKVAGHTLVVELIAKQISSSRLSITEAVNLTCKHGFSNIGLEKVSYVKDEQEYNDTIANIITALFDASNLSVERKIILKMLSLFTVSGIELGRIQELLGLPTKDDFNELEREGWLYIEKMYVKLHPVVSETIALWKWNNEYYEAAFSMIMKLFRKIKLEDKKEEQPKPRVEFMNTGKKYIRQNPKIQKWIREFMIKKEGVIGETAYERIMRDDAWEPTDQEELQKYVCIAEELLEGSRKVEKLYFSDMYKELLYRVVVALPRVREDYIIEKTKELFRLGVGKWRIVFQLYGILISIYSERRDFDMCELELMNAKKYLLEHSNHYANAMYFDMYATYYDAKLDGAYDCETEESREQLGQLLESLDKAIYHIKRTKGSDGKIFLARLLISKANVLIRSNPENKEEIDKILESVEKLQEKYTLPYSESRCDYGMSRAWYYTLVEPYYKGFTISIEYAYKVAQKTLVTELELIDKLIIPVANMLVQWELYQKAADLIDLGIRMCEEYKDILPYMRKKYDLLHYQIDIYYYAKDFNKCREIISIIDKIDREAKGYGVFRAISEEIHNAVLGK